MSKQKIVKRVQDTLGAETSAKQIEDVLGAVFAVIGNLDEGQSCRIRDFGVFKVKKRGERKGTSLPSASGKKSKTTTIPARLAMTFKISKKFKEMINPEPAPVKKKAKKAKKAKKKSKKS